MGWLVVGWGKQKVHKVTRQLWYKTLGLTKLMTHHRLAQPLTGARVSQLEQRHLPTMVIVSLTVI